MQVLCQLHTPAQGSIDRLRHPSRGKKLKAYLDGSEAREPLYRVMDPRFFKHQDDASRSDASKVTSMTRGEESRSMDSLFAVAGGATTSWANKLESLKKHNVAYSADELLQIVACHYQLNQLSTTKTDYFIHALTKPGISEARLVRLVEEIRASLGRLYPTSRT